MNKRNVTFPVRNEGGMISLKSEYIIEQSIDKSVLTWTKLVFGNSNGQRIGFQSRLFKDKDFQFNAWIKFVVIKPKNSDNFGLKVCGSLYTDFLSECSADEWCLLKEDVYCDGGDYNSIILIFDSVKKEGQQVKMFDVTLTEIGKSFKYMI